MRTERPLAAMAPPELSTNEDASQARRADIDDLETGAAVANDSTTDASYAGCRGATADDGIAWARTCPRVLSRTSSMHNFAVVVHC